MSGMGEGDTIVNYPHQVEALVVAARDPVASMANRDELQALISPEGWQPSVETRVNELEGLNPSALLVWGPTIPSAEQSQPRRQLLPFLTLNSRCSTPDTPPG